MKLRKSIVAAFAVLSSFALLAPASANEICYDIDVQAQGQTLVDQSGCQDLP